MKTKFSSIVQIKEQKLKDVEAELSRARAQQRRAQEDLQKAIDEIHLVEIPKSGSISLLQLANMTLVNLQGVKKQKEQFLSICEQKVQEVLHLYQLAHMDFEKMKHLHEVEVAKHIKKLKELEQKELDEMSVVLYNLQHKEEE